MSTAYFYDNFITRKIRFAYRNALIKRMNSLQPYQATVEGCYITNTTSYVDIILSNVSGISSTNPVFDFIYKSSYIRFVNNTDGIEYFAFIDRVEPNNFNSQNYNGVQYEKYYRVYITIDWWTTIMYKDDNGSIIGKIKENLEGNVERAHVNDIIKDSDTCRYTMDYTNERQEFPVERYVITSDRLFPKLKLSEVNSVFGKPFILWAISSKMPDSSNAPGQSVSATVRKIGDRIYPMPLTMYIIPTFDCTIKFDTYLNTKEGSTSQNIEVEYPNVYWGVDVITDSSVISLFCTDFYPYTYITDNNQTNLKMSYGNDINSTKFSTPPSDVKYKGIIQSSYSSVGYKNSNIVTRYYPVHIQYTYEDYLNKIAKQYFSPYTIVSIDSGSSSIPLDTAHISTEILFDYLLLPDIGGQALYLKVDTLREEERYKLIANNSTYERLGTNDEFTQRKRLNMILSEVGNQFSSAQRLLSSASTFNFGVAASTATDMVSSPINTYNNYKKSLRDGEYGYKSSDGALANIVSPPVITVREPLPEIKNALLKDLALYGYNTYLHPHEIFGFHDRKYFNYIKLNNAEIVLSELNTEIKLSIEEMFNNGVWLWNTKDSFGNFEVPNYPKQVE